MTRGIRVICKGWRPAHGAHDALGVRNFTAVVMVVLDDRTSQARWDERRNRFVVIIHNRIEGLATVIASTASTAVRCSCRCCRCGCIASCCGNPSSSIKRTISIPSQILLAIDHQPYLVGQARPPVPPKCDQVHTVASIRLHVVLVAFLHHFNGRTHPSRTMSCEDRAGNIGHSVHGPDSGVRRKEIQIVRDDTRLNMSHRHRTKGRFSHVAHRERLSNES